MDAEDLIRAVVGYKCGDAVADQVIAVIDNPEADVNGNAIRMARDTMDGLLQLLASTSGLDDVIEQLEVFMER